MPEGKGLKEKLLLGNRDQKIQYDVNILEGGVAEK